MQKNQSTDGGISPLALAIGASSVSLVLCTAVSIIAIINHNMTLGGVFAVLAVGSHLNLWRLLNKSHREKEAAAGENDC